MMVVCTNDNQKSLKEPWMDEPVEFASTGTARVKEEIGERLVDEINDIKRYED